MSFGFCADLAGSPHKKRRHTDACENSLYNMTAEYTVQMIGVSDSLDFSLFFYMFLVVKQGAITDYKLKIRLIIT